MKSDTPARVRVRSDDAVINQWLLDQTTTSSRRPVITRRRRSATDRRRRPASA